MYSNIDDKIKLKEYTEKDILSELKRILSSDLFLRSSVLSNFLKFIVEETLGGRTEHLKEYTIGVNALGKPADFNPQIDAIVRIHAGRLRRLLSEYYATFGNTNSMMIEVVKGTYVPVFRNYLSKADKKPGVNVDNPIPYTRTKLTIGILPFRNFCPKNEYQFFVDGFGEELTRLLSMFQSVDVIAHHSTRKYASGTEDIPTIGSELGVHYLICGSVKRSTEEIIANISLVETLKGTQVWTETYNHKLHVDNLINIQNEIVEKVGSILGGHYGFLVHDNFNVQRQSMLSLDSFDGALWHYYFHINYSLEAYNKTRQALEKALKYDPDYALGLAILSELYLDAKSLGFPTIDNPIEEAYKMAKKAIKLDPQCQMAFQQFAWANIYLKKKEEAIKAMDRCLKLNPSSVSSKGAVGFGWACIGEYDRAQELLTESLALNPHCPWWFHFGFFIVYFQKKKYKIALEYANKIDASDVFFDPLCKAAAKAQLGLISEALIDVKNLKKNNPDVSNNLRMYLDAFLMDTNLIDEIIQSLNKVTGNVGH